MNSPIIEQSQQKLLSPHQFYQLCQNRKNLQEPLYFLTPNPQWLNNTGITTTDLQHFLDDLALYVRQTHQMGKKQRFYLQNINFFCDNLTKQEILINKNKPFNPQYPSVKIKTEIIGCGMIGRVAKITINNSPPLAFKAFFESNFIWHHGVWAEIPVGLYLKAQGVTKDIPEFQFAGETWAVWEWIDEQISPQFRPGLLYRDFAKQHHLTQFNPLNLSNYNAHKIRLDLGGVQKEYRGRRWVDMVKTFGFYWDQASHQGILNLWQHFMANRLMRYGLIKLARQFMFNFAFTPSFKGVSLKNTPRKE